MDNVNFLSVSGTAVRVVCFATVILSRNATHSLSLELGIEGVV